MRYFYKPGDPRASGIDHLPTLRAVEDYRVVESEWVSCTEAQYHEIWAARNTTMVLHQINELRYAYLMKEMDRAQNASRLV